MKTEVRTTLVVAEALGDLIDLANRETTGITVTELRDKILAGLLAAASECSLAIIRLSDGITVRPCEALLRSLVESWIIARFVINDDTNTRARRYVVREAREQQRYASRLLRLIESNPRDGEKYLRGEFTSRDELMLASTELSQEIEGYRADGITDFPTLGDCARELGPDYEYMYLRFFGYILSDRVHVGPRTAIAYLEKGESDAERRREQMQRAVASALTFYLAIATVATERLGRPSLDQLEPFKQLLDEVSELSSR